MADDDKDKKEEKKAAKKKNPTGRNAQMLKGYCAVIPIDDRRCFVCVEGCGIGVFAVDVGAAISAAVDDK